MTDAKADSPVDENPLSNQADLRQAIAEAGWVLEGSGLGDLVWGHVSARDPHGRGAWLKAAGRSFDEVTADDVVLVSDEGEVLGGQGRRHIEYPIHTEIYRVRLDVGAIVHAHPLHAVAFAATAAPLRALSHDAVPFTPPDICRFADTSNLIRTPELGALLASRLGDRNAVLIPGHGIVTVGHDLATAVFLAVLLEKACRQHLVAGNVVEWSSDTEALAKREDCWPATQICAGYDHLLRVARRRVDVPHGTS